MIEEDENTPKYTFENTDNLIELAHHIVAFANSEGGTLILGINKNNKIIGITPEFEKQKITKIIENYITPTIGCFFHETKEGYKMVLHVKVLKSENKTIYFINGSKKEIYLTLNQKIIKANNILEKFYKFRDLNKQIPDLISVEESSILNLISLSNQISTTQIFKKLKLTRNTIEYILVRLLYRNLIKINLIGNTFFISLR
jgi:predicted HTH transcriptional regulator